MMIGEHGAIRYEALVGQYLQDLLYSGIHVFRHVTAWNDKVDDRRLQFLGGDELWFGVHGVLGGFGGWGGKFPALTEFLDKRDPCFDQCGKFVLFHFDFL